MKCNRVLCVTVIAGTVISGCSWHWRRRPQTLGYVPLQGKLEQPVADVLTNAPNNKLFSIVVAMERQVTTADKRLLFQSIAASNQVQRMEQQRTNLIAELQHVAQLTQAPFLNHLHALESNGVVRNVRSLWLSNMIGLEAPRSVIEALATSNEVQSIHLDMPQPVIQSVSEIPWGLKQIGVNFPVATAVKQTVVVAVLDTGVDYTHHDLANHIWVNPREDLNGNKKLDVSDINNKDDDENGFPDDVIGWNFSGAGTNDPQDVHGHGTHIAGIIVGDGTDGVRTGIAPEAQIMALRESSSFAEPTSTEQECWLGMQYAVSNKAHIINFSSGWMAANKPAYAMWRNAVDNATDAGVLFVTVSGDSGTSAWPPHSVTTPGRVSSALTVGSSTSNDSIPQWSCEGPITWEDIGPWRDYPFSPGLLKPDLVAPGIDIKSTQRGGGYVKMTGTSMAAPHVAGVAALLRAQNPDLTPYEVRYILEETAFDINSYGPNPSYGWGRLDGAAAVAFPPIDATPYNLALDNLRVQPSPQLNIPLLFFATVTNLGGQVVGNAELQFYFADAPTRTEADLEPLADGKPDPAKFEYIGSYFVPVIGPTKSRHGRLQGVVRKIITKPRQDNWWLGVRILSGPTSDKEIDASNNGKVLRFAP